MIHILSWTTQKHQKNTFQANTFKVEEKSGTFQGLAQKFKDFSRKKWNSRTFPRTSPKIQGLFKTVRTLLQKGGIVVQRSCSSFSDNSQKVNIFYLPSKCHAWFETRGGSRKELHFCSFSDNLCFCFCSIQGYSSCCLCHSRIYDNFSIRQIVRVAISFFNAKQSAWTD